MGRSSQVILHHMTSNGFTLADPNDRGMLDVAGFDTSVPAVISYFVRAA
jgi:60 kDa SS-A/Ro ribonucleoprotein